jgi:carbon storage regulator CsrA
MLVLTRKMDERFIIGDNIVVTIVEVKGKRVRVGIEAPRAVRVVRGELRARDAQAAANPPRPSARC